MQDSLFEFTYGVFGLVNYQYFWNQSTFYLEVQFLF